MVPCRQSATGRDTDQRRRERARQAGAGRLGVAEALAHRIAVSAGVPVAELRAGRRTRSVSHARRLLCQLAVRRLAYPGATVARFLGVTTSAVNRAAWSAPLPELEEFT